MTELTDGGADEAKWLRWRRVADLYHAYFTGLILTTVTRRGTADAAEFVFRVFRRQQQERFLPGEVSRAMLRGWHANNGVSLGNPNLGFVCTKQSVDGQDGLEGYYCEYDHALEIDQRLVFARHLEAPLFDPATAPALPVADWPKPRLQKAYRNYAMEYVRTAAPVMVQLFGPE